MPRPSRKPLVSRRSRPIAPRWNRLPPMERDLVLARVELGLQYAQVAELLERPSPSAARMATSRALVRLAREMSRDRR